MGELFLPGIFVLAATMLVIRGNGRVVVPGYSEYSGFPKQLDCFVGPRSVPHEVTQMKGGVHARLPADVLQDCLEGGKVGMNVGDQGIARHGRLTRPKLCAS